MQRLFVTRFFLILSTWVIMIGSAVTVTGNSIQFLLTAEEEKYLSNLRARPVIIAYSFDLVHSEFDSECYGTLDPVLNVLRKKFGLTVKLLKANWHDAFGLLESGAVDFYGPITISQERYQEYITVTPFFRNYSKMITRKDAPVHSIIGLYNKKIGLLEGSVISATLKTYLGPKGQTVYFASMTDMIEGLRDETIDAFATVDDAAFEIMAHDDIQFEFTIDNFYVDQGLISHSEDMRILAGILNRYLALDPLVSGRVIEARRKALIKYSQQRYKSSIDFLQDNYSEITLFSDAMMYPLCYMQDGEIKGMVLEINDFFTELTGLNISIESDSQSGVLTAIEKLKTGEYMAVVAAYYSHKYLKNANLQYSPLLWMDTLRTYSYHNFDNLLGKTLGATRLTAEYLDWNNITGNTSIIYDSYYELINALRNGDVDAVFIGETRFNYGYSVGGEYNLGEVTDISATVPMHMLYGAENKAFNELYNESLVLFNVLSPTSVGYWKSLNGKFKADFIRMRYSQQIWATVVIIVFIIMIAALVYLFLQNRKAYKKTKAKLLHTLDVIHYDALTGIYNRRFFDDKAERIIKSLSRSGGILTMMIIDVDFFKRYNDTYGHSEGDVCLKSVARVIKNSLMKDGDFVARYGGEEFVVVLPNTDENGARVLAGRILKNVSACDIKHEKSDAADYVTVSIGVTAYSPSYTLGANDFVKRADEALYISKQGGRNRYTFLNFY